MGKKGDLTDFERGMVVGARRAGLSISNTADVLGQPSRGLTENGPKKRKYPVSGSCVDENALLISEVRGEWAEWFEMIEGQQLLKLALVTTKVCRITSLNAQLVEP